MLRETKLTLDIVCTWFFVTRQQGSPTRGTIPIPHELLFFLFFFFSFHVSLSLSVFLLYPIRLVSRARWIIFERECHSAVVRLPETRNNRRRYMYLTRYTWCASSLLHLRGRDTNAHNEKLQDRTTLQVNGQPSDYLSIEQLHVAKIYSWSPVKTSGNNKFLLVAIN